jgi:hypothetical protein
MSRSILPGTEVMRTMPQVLREAELCFRCAKSPGLKREIAEGLEAAGHELMAKAVEIDTIMERGKRKK